MNLERRAGVMEAMTESMQLLKTIDIDTPIATQIQKDVMERSILLTLASRILDYLHTDAISEMERIGKEMGFR